MTNDNHYKTIYLEWLMDKIYPYHIKNSYTELSLILYSIDFTPIFEEDKNRYQDGIDLRKIFGAQNNFSKEDINNVLNDGPCSILEMMAALALRLEEAIMSNPYEYPYDRTSVWFMSMLTSIGIDSQTNDIIDENWVKYKISMLNDRKYSYNGEGGLFTLKNPKYDMTKCDLWYQANMYANEFDDN